MLNAVLERLIRREDLTEIEASSVADALMTPDLPAPLAGALLAALRAKGETVAEVRGFVRALQARAVRVPVPQSGAPLVDTAGTGGDGSNSLNLSTASALVAAAAGCRVVKHGNRAVSSKCGSADVLEASGVMLARTPDQAVRQLAAADFTFLFAPAFHPALKVVGAIRKALGVRTVFNLLGPLLNPVGPDAQVIGVATEAVGHLIAEAAAGLKVPRVLVVHGADGWDEATPVGPYMLWSVAEGQVRTETRDPADLGIARCQPEDLRGAEPQTNAERLQAVLRGQEHGAHRDAVLLGAALTLEVAGLETDPAAALARGARAIDEGGAGRVLDGLQAFTGSESASADDAKRSGRPRKPQGYGRLRNFVADSQRRVATLPPVGQLARQAADAPPPRAVDTEHFGVIAEVKFRAPSVTGALGSASPDEAVRRAQAYLRGGASAISVLTCPEGFDGHIDHMRAVAESVRAPVMRKDFLVDPAQVFEARIAGASGVLLVARILDDLSAMLQASSEAGLFALVEVFDEDDIARLPAIEPRDDVFIGVNARCLDTLSVITDRHRRLRPRLPPGFVTVAESGLATPEDGERVVNDGYDLALVGYSLMDAPDPAAAVHSIVEAGRRAQAKRSREEARHVREDLRSHV